ncbi:MAG: 50S ribosomal protein L17 [Spirochaetales bacterium]|nr:50S ribosomal protein L17 [Spirochaetales bacterium]MCF7937811.1 50S ribosomal protein L17 [Spirochaetales bacterium]
MKHRVGYNRLSRKTSHRKAMTRNMITSLFRYERVKTTKAKAREIRKAAEKLITRAKADSVHNRREIAKKVYDSAVVAKLFTDIAPRYENRPGGYTRILKLSTPRKNDAAEMVLLELVSEEEEKDSKKPSKKTKESKSQTKKAKQPVADKDQKKSSKTEVAVDEAEYSDEGKQETENTDNAPVDSETSEVEQSEEKDKEKEE